MAQAGIPPTARRVGKVFTEHGSTRRDDYYWLRDRDNPEVVEYLAAENAYYASVMAPLSGLVAELFSDMVARIPAVPDDVAQQNGDYFYYWRTPAGASYPLYARKLAANRAQLATAPEQIILDINQLAAPSGYLALGVVRVSPNQRYLAYTIDRDGSERFTCYVKDTVTGEILSDVIPDIYGGDYETTGGPEWALDGSRLYYVRTDDTGWANQVWCHQLGTATNDDVLLFEEFDKEFWVDLTISADGRFIFINSRATTTSEVWVIDGIQPLASPWLFQQRLLGIEYTLDHWQGELIVLTNKNAPNSKLVGYPVTDFLRQATNPKSTLILGEAVEMVPPQKDIWLKAVYPVADQLYLFGRANGLTEIWQLKGRDLVKVTWDEEIYHLAPQRPYPGAAEFIVNYESLLKPKTSYALNPETSEKHIIWQQEVGGDYLRTNYTQQRVIATAADGTEIPILLVHRTDALVTGSAPLILYGYGAYGIPVEPTFSAPNLTLLDRGVILATAQIRGGGEFGSQWYEQGRSHHRQNSFTDYLAAAEYLITSGITTTEMLAGRGESAGGTLMGVVANMAGDRFRVLVAQVPAVDVVNTLMDETIVGAVANRVAYGNPALENDYRYLLSYSPYDNITAKDYPAMYLTAGLNDTRVSYWEVAKWVAKLRALKTDNNTIVLKTNLSGGHFGSPARWDSLKGQAEMYAFVLHNLLTSG